MTNKNNYFISSGPTRTYSPQKSRPKIPELFVFWDTWDNFKNGQTTFLEKYSYSRKKWPRVVIQNNNSRFVKTKHWGEIHCATKVRHACTEQLMGTIFGVDSTLCGDHFRRYIKIIYEEWARNHFGFEAFNRDDVLAHIPPHSKIVCPNVTKMSNLWDFSQIDILLREKSVVQVDSNKTTQTFGI